jgi:hypothetical protein
MSRFTDRRSTGAGKGAPANAPEVERVMALAGKDDDVVQAVDAHVPAPRRIAPGARTFSQFFDGDKQRRELTRGEWLNLMSMLEYQRYESRWWRRIWRWLHHLPQVASFIPAMREAHARTLEEAKASLLKAQEDIRLRLLAEKEKHSQQAVEGKGDA